MAGVLGCAQSVSNALNQSKIFSNIFYAIKPKIIERDKSCKQNSKKSQAKSGIGKFLEFYVFCFLHDLIKCNWIKIKLEITKLNLSL